MNEIKIYLYGVCTYQTTSVKDGDINPYPANVENKAS
jgi:hypothetical protein